MLTAKFDPQSFFQQRDNVALHVPASELFGLLKRSIDLPAQWGALIGRTTGDQATVRAGGILEADGAEDVLFVRLTPVECQVAEDSLVSSDGFSFQAEAGLRLHPIADRAELSAFLRTLVGSRRVVQAEGLAKYLQPAIHSALSTFVNAREAAQLAEVSARTAASEAVAGALQDFCFSAGIALEQAPVVRFESASFRTVQKAREDSAARRAEHEAAQQVGAALRAARAEHLDHLGGLLERLREMAAASPGVELPELIRTFSERQRGELYEALFATDAPTTKTQWIIVAAGDEIIFFDAAKPGVPTRRLRLEGEAGPARSVQPAESDGAKVLLIGAARGVYRRPIDRALPEATFLAEPGAGVRGGFNSAALSGGRLIATHSELGIYEWHSGDPKSAWRRFESLTSGAKAVRNAAAFGDHTYCSIDDRIIRWPLESTDDSDYLTFFGAKSLISALEVGAEGVFAGTSEGDVLFWPSGQTENPQLLHRGMSRACESVRLQRFHGVRRLVFADTSPRIHARVVGDSFTFHYEAGGQTLRRVETAPDLIVATNELRDRLFCWRPAQPDKPVCTINVAAMTGRNIQDVCLSV